MQGINCFECEEYRKKNNAKKNVWCKISKHTEEINSTPEIEYLYDPVWNTYCPHCLHEKNFFTCLQCNTTPCSLYGCGTMIYNSKMCVPYCSKHICHSNEDDI